MTDQERKAMKMALEALDSCEFDYDWEERPYKTFDEDLVNVAVDALRQALAQPEPWDTSDMAHRTGGLTVEQSIAQPEQEPVAWWTGKEKSEDEDFMYPKTRQAHIQHPNSAAANFYLVPLYTAPPSKPWVSLTDDERESIILESYRKYNDGHPDFIATEIEAALKEKNNG